MSETANSRGHQLFSQLYSATDWGSDPERAKRRWSGVEALSDNPGNEDIEGLIRIAYKTKQPPTSAQVKSVRGAFRSADDSFDLQGNDREIQVLAAATLGALVNRSSDAASTAALALTTSTAFVSRGSDLPVSLSEVAEKAIHHRADAARERPDLIGHLKLGKIDLSTAANKFREQADAEGLASAFGGIAQVLNRTLGQWTSDVESLLNNANTFISIQDEELQMLWWLTGQRSWDLACAFGDVPMEGRPLILAKELAAFTQCLPGPRSAAALLVRAGITDVPVTIPDAVNGCRREWLDELVRDAEPSPITKPIHFAIKRKLETTDDSAWIAGWSATSEASATLTVPAIQLATMFYRERLLSSLPLA